MYKLRKNNKKLIWRISMFLGIFLIIAAIGVFVLWQYSLNNNAQKVQEYVSLISEMIPEQQNAVIEEKNDNVMPVASIKQKDFIGLLEFTANKKTLPICAKWENVDAYPCKYRGSIYDKTLILGASDSKGQIDFIENVFVADKITVTDMLGDRYSYKIADIRYSDNADYENLTKGDYDLTIFINKTYSFDYIIINCVAAGTN